MSKNKSLSVLKLKFLTIKTIALSTAKSLLAFIPKFSISFTVEHPIALLEKVEEYTKTCGKKGPRSFGHLSLVHGAESMANKVQSAVADTSVVSALLVSVIFPYLMELPQPIQDTDKVWIKVVFLVLVWSSCICFLFTIMLIAILNAACNFWVREADLQAMLYRGGTAMHTWSVRLHMIATYLALLAAVVSQSVMQFPNLPASWCIGLLLFLFWVSYVVNAAYMPGLALMRGDEADFDKWFKHGIFGYSGKRENGYGVFFDNACHHLSETRANLPEEEREKDLMDVPLDVFRSQAKLGELFDDNQWRELQTLGNTVTDSTKNPLTHDTKNMDEASDIKVNILRDIFRKIDDRFPNLYCDAFVEAEIEESQLAQLTNIEIVEVFGAPLGHAMKMTKYFKTMD